MKITTAEIDKAIAKAIEKIRQAADQTHHAEDLGFCVLVEDALAHLHESVPGMQALAARYNAPDILEPIQAFLALNQGHTDHIDLGDDEDDDHEPEPVRNRRDSPGLVRTGADRDREMSYEDYRELTRPEEPLGDNEDL